LRISSFVTFSKVPSPAVRRTVIRLLERIVSGEGTTLNLM